jgi:biotin transport system substrate-specific component
MEKLVDIRKLVITALFAGLIWIGGVIAIPIGPIPVVLANLFVIAAGLILGPGYGSLAVFIYLLLGALGLPVFSGGRGGLGVFAGPTGGYLVGYLLAAVVAGIIALIPNKFGRMKFLYFFAALAAVIAIYIPGLAVLKANLDLTWNETLAMGLYPFLLGDILKALVAAAAALALNTAKEDK